MNYLLENKRVREIEYLVFNVEENDYTTQVLLNNIEQYDPDFKLYIYILTCKEGDFLTPLNQILSFYMDIKQKKKQSEEERQVQGDNQMGVRYSRRKYSQFSNK